METNVETESGESGESGEGGVRTEAERESGEGGAKSGGGVRSERESGGGSESDKVDIYIYNLRFCMHTQSINKNNDTKYNLERGCGAVPRLKIFVFARGVAGASAS